jgi:hypothetical protein
MLSKQINDTLTRAVALYNLAMVDAADGQLVDAKGTLAEAREAFSAFEGLEVAMVDEAQESLGHNESPGSAPGPDRTPTGEYAERSGPDRTMTGGGVDYMGRIDI